VKKVNLSQEVLLLINSSFTRKELWENDLPENNKMTASRQDKLEEACRNGLLQDWLPGTIKSEKKGEKLFLWKIYPAKAFLCVELSQMPPSLSPAYSLNPYLFLALRNYN